MRLSFSTRRFVYSAVIVAILFIGANAYAARQSLDERLEQGAVIKNITIPEGQSWAYVKVQTLIDSKPDALWAALKDIQSWPRWLPMNKVARVLPPDVAAKITKDIASKHDEVLSIVNGSSKVADDGKESGHWQKMVYEEYNLPWPIKDEWVVRLYTYDEKDGVDRASWRKMDSTEKDDDGYWEIKPWGDGGKTLLDYYYRVKAKESVPAPIFKTAVSFTVNSMIKALKHEAGKREGVARLR